MLATSPCPQRRQGDQRQYRRHRPPSSADYARLCREVTAQRVADSSGHRRFQPSARYELPNLQALNFVVRGILARPLRVDAQGKALGQAILEMPLEENHERRRVDHRASDEATAVLTLNRPERRNALTIELMECFARRWSRSPRRSSAAS